MRYPKEIYNFNLLFFRFPKEFQKDEIANVETITEEEIKESSEQLETDPTPTTTTTATSSTAPTKSSPAKKLTPQKHKSFEMEDIPDENPIKCHPEGLSSVSR